MQWKTIFFFSNCNTNFFAVIYSFKKVVQRIPFFFFRLEIWSPSNKWKNYINFLRPLQAHCIYVQFFLSIAIVWLRRRKFSSGHKLMMIDSNWEFKMLHNDHIQWHIQLYMDKLKQQDLSLYINRLIWIASHMRIKKMSQHTLYMIANAVRFVRLFVYYTNRIRNPTLISALRWPNLYRRMHLFDTLQFQKTKK